MEEADKDWMVIRMVVGECFFLVPAHPVVVCVVVLVLFPCKLGRKVGMQIMSAYYTQYFIIC